MIKKVTLNTLIILITLVNLFSFNVFAEEQEEVNSEEEKERFITFTFEQDFTRYIWHGVPYTKELAFQPSLFIKCFNTRLNIWSNVLLTNTPYEGVSKTVIGGGKFSEIDFILTHTIELDKFTIEPTIAYYHYCLGSDPNSAELGINLTYNLLDNFKIYTNNTLDFMNSPGAYYGELGLEYEHDLLNNLKLNLLSKIGWANAPFNKNYVDIYKDALHALEGNIILTYYYNDNLYIKPHLDITKILDNDINNKVEEKEIINLGLLIGVDF